MRKQFKIALTQRDIYNIGPKMRAQQLNGKTYMDWMTENFYDRKFFVRLEIDNCGRLTRIFFSHLESLARWKRSPDILLLDCTYRTNRFNIPLLNTCGSSTSMRHSLQSRF